MRKLIYILFILFSIISFGQTIVALKGKIIVETNDNDGITIVNKTSKLTTISQNGGYFSIQAKLNDTIMFSAIHLVGKTHIVTSKDFGKDLLFIKLDIYTRHIKEIMITNADNISAESIGLVPKGQRKYTPAERRLKTAGDFDSLFGLNTAFSIDPLINAISGRTKQLKAELEVEKKEFLQNKINTNFEKDYISKVYHIPPDFVEGFVFYIVEDKTLVEAIKAKNKTLVSFKMSSLAVDYLKLKNLQPFYEPIKTEEIIPEENPKTETKKDE